jgi:dsDNA-binding SOS-regulon protein
MTSSEKTSVSFEPKNEEELATFFQANKEIFHEIWIVLANKKYSNPQPVSFNQAVSEAIKQGLIDSKTKTLNKQKYAIRFTKRIKSH